MDDPFAPQREDMLREQIQRRGIRSARVLDALRRTPRHEFVTPEHRGQAYADGPLPIGHGQTISQPYIVALMTQLLSLEGDETVLEIGTGSGYQAAVLGLLARQVYTVERIPALAQEAAARLERLGLTNVRVIEGDGSIGLPAYAPYDAVLVTAGAPQVPAQLLEQLALGGRLVLPVGPRYAQTLERWEKTPSGLEHEAVLPVSFVPLRGEEGWAENTF